jgi:DNA-binding response OmpR family regulator
MTTSPHTILIVEYGSLPAADLRQAFQRASADVHVVNNIKAAMNVARAKRLSGAIIDRNCLDSARDLCEELTKTSVPYVFQSAPATNVVDVMFALIGSGPSTPRFFQQV